MPTRRVGAHLRVSVPTMPCVMTGILGIFLVLAALGTWIPSLVHDRFPKQFTPVWEFFLSVGRDGPADPGVVAVAARISQYIIGLTELVAGVALLAAVAYAPKRLVLTNFGCGLAAGLFGAFMVTMFIIHDRSLPTWNQYPAILAWIALTWIMASLAEARPEIFALRKSGSKSG